MLLGGMAVMGLIAGGGLGLGAMGASLAGEPSRSRTLRIGQGVIAFTVAILGLTLSAQTFGDPPPEGTARLSMAGLSLILLGTGAVLGRVAPNRLVGVRTPWSHKSRLAWDRSNRLAGRLLFLLGLIGLFTAPWAPQPAATLSLIAAALIAAALSTFESWRVWRADPDRQPL
ncbi:SdpI family protein [Brevundimonas sp. SORGH_AS_0993]|uniref:SdpI family protein n=1 Tax=Brevundimonas sp. SORGH_AS_0993 TaxID=3041794 RepID=UPI0027890956|nr:SdpI family protein [Brevundimonas sp. SORGH_AS_0993]MDQ1152846.1 putative membrane protein [Brevundimonas sp. SORGH_AS_0993]